MNWVTKGQFTWRTIQTWWYWYRQNGLVIPQPRADKGFPRKTNPEQLLEAIEKVIPLFRPCDDINIAAIYRACIEKGYLHRDQIAPNTFRRHVNHHQLLKGFDELQDGPVRKARLAFAKAHANDSGKSIPYMARRCPLVRRKRPKPI